MPTAKTTTEDSRSKLVQNHPHDFTKKRKKEGLVRQAAIGNNRGKDLRAVSCRNAISTKIHAYQHSNV
jgi:hypothetical protein